MSTEEPGERARPEELAAAQEEFLRVVSHDLRAPLRHVTSYAALLQEVLREIPDPPDQVSEALGFAETMRQSASRMAAMLDGLQAISRAGRAPLRRQAVDVRAVIDEARRVLPGADQVRWKVQADLPEVQADALLFAQLMQELLANAVKFSRGRDPRCVQVTGVSLSDGQVRLSVTDNGVGFDGAHAQGLTGMFQRMHREDEFEGVGAGLALCQRIAERHGARMAISAKPDNGCIVQLDWPAH